MPLNMNNMPTDKPSVGGGKLGPIEPGMYPVTVTKATVDISPNSNKYIELEFTLANKRKMWAKLYDVDKPLPQYKIAAFIRAVGLNFGNTEFELKDVAKVCVNKQLMIDIMIKDNGYNDIDIEGDKKGFYPLPAAQTDEPVVNNSDDY